MSLGTKLSIGLVTSGGAEADRLKELLTQHPTVAIKVYIAPSEIQPSHIAQQDLHVWLLDIQDEDWVDALDELLDLSPVPVFFNDRGSLLEQKHQEIWIRKLVSRLYHIAGLEEKVSSEDINNENEGFMAESDDSIARLESATQDLSSALVDITQQDNVGEHLPNSSIEADEFSEDFDSGDPLAATLTESSESDGLDYSVAIEEDSVSTQDIIPTESSEPALVPEPGQNVATSSNDGLEFTDHSERSDDFKLDEVSGLEQAPEQLELTDSIELGAELESRSELESSSELENSFDVENSLELESGLEFESDSALETELELNDISEIESSPELASLELENSFHGDDELDTKIDFALDANEPNQEPLQSSESSLDSEFEGLDLSLIGAEESEPTSWESSLAEFESNLDDVIAQEQSEQKTDELENEPVVTLPMESSLSDFDAPLAEDSEQSFHAITESDSEATNFELELTVDKLPESHEEIDSEIASEQQDFNISREVGGSKFTESELSMLDDAEHDSQVLEVSESDFVAEPEPLDTAVTLEPLSPLDSQENNTELSFELGVPSEVVTENETATPTMGFAELGVDSTGTEHHEFEPQELEPQALEPVDTLEFEPMPVDDVIEAPAPESHFVNEEAPEFEIPLLDDAAVNMQFEEQLDLNDSNVAQVKPTPQAESVPPQKLWVLGASLGGPAAIKRFFQALPDDVPAAFLLGQHIDESFLPVLANILDSQTGINAKVLETNTKIENGWVYIAPIHSQLAFNQANQIFLTNQPWTPPYAPCIDDLVATAAKAFGENTGVIIFSGMGDDGRKGAEIAQQHKATIWAQSPETSANSSMPEAIINNNYSEYIASPEELAGQLSHVLQQG